MVRTSQTVNVLGYMYQHGSINPKQAIEELNCYRLSARIADLKKRGIGIKTELIYYKNESGESKHYAQYSLEKG